jgi:hypothetical protein
MKVSRGPTNSRALGVPVRRHDHTSPDSRVVDCLPTHAQEFLGMGWLDNDRRGMVWHLAISVPIA